MARWQQRFLSTARGQVVDLLRRGSRTVDDLARALGLTDNAVRAQLAALERDGLVEQRGLRRGTGRPAYAYGLTPEADALFATAYGELLRRTIGELAARHGPAEAASVLRAVGRDLAGALGGPVPGATFEERLEAVAGVLGDLGGLAEVRQQDGAFRLEGYACPLRAIVPDHPEACQLALALVQALLGDESVTECCQRGAEPRCAFAVAAPAAVTPGPAPPTRPA